MERNDEDMQVDLMEIMINLVEVAGDLLGANAASKEKGDDDGDIYENDSGPFIALSEFSINIISSPICSNAWAKGGEGYSKLICDCLKPVCSGGKAFMYTCPLTQANLKIVTSVMLEYVCVPELIMTSQHVIGFRIVRQSGKITLPK